MNKTEILIIDDEPQIRKLLRINLETNDYKIIEAETGQQGIQLAASHQPDLILLDIGLPDKSGHEILQDLRTWFHKSIIILSVQNSEESIVSALDLGASDYVTKPFRISELLARIRSALRRNVKVEMKHSVVYGDLSIDFVSKVVKRQEEMLKLTLTEYKLLVIFAQNEGRVLTHQFLLKEIWGVAYQIETQYLRVFVGTLRKKIEINPNEPLHIITENGIGYRFQ